MLQLAEGCGERAVHLAPDLAGRPPTYRDHGPTSRRAGRASRLRQARPGDAICFLARLQPHKAPAGFHLVGVLEVDELRADLTADPGSGWWDANAHLRRARACGRWDSFWVFRGGTGSGLLARGVP